MSHSCLSAEGTWTLHKQSEAYLEVPQNEIYPILPSKRYVIVTQLAFITKYDSDNSQWSNCSV